MKTYRVIDLRTGIVREAHPKRDWKQAARNSLGVSKRLDEQVRKEMQRRRRLR